MHDTLRRVRSALIAIVVLALSAGLTFGAQPPSAASTGLANAGAHAGKTVPVAGAQAGEDEDGEGEEVDETGDDETGDDETGDDETGDDETGDDETGEEGLEGEDEVAGEESDEAGGNCLLDPTLLTEDELAAMKHGSVVCWAAHQTEWPEEFKNHGAWVRSWAQWGKDDEETEDGTTEDGGTEDGETVDEDGATLEDAQANRGKGQGKGHGKGKGKTKHNRD
jgi:hypothetical protein